MNEKESFNAQQEAQREVAGQNSPQTRERIWAGLTKYLAAEARHAHEVAKAEQEARGRRSE